MKIGLMGIGSIGKFLLNTINVEKKVPGVKIETIFDERSSKLETVQEISKKYGAEFIHDKQQFLNNHLDMYLECTQPDVAKAYASDILKTGKDMMMVSVGALTDKAFLKELCQCCIENNSHVFLPSGAIGGLDALAAADALGEVESVELITRKHPDALSLSVENSDPIIVYSGNAIEAIDRFPKNINVATTLSIVGLGVEETTVQIIADPNVGRNLHEVVVKGSFGQLKLQLENSPMPNNPKTSYLAALSVLSMLQKLRNPIKIG